MRAGCRATLYVLCVASHMRVETLGPGWPTTVAGAAEVVQVGLALIGRTPRRPLISATPAVDTDSDFDRYKLSLRVCTLVRVCVSSVRLCGCADRVHVKL